METYTKEEIELTDLVEKQKSTTRWLSQEEFDRIKFLRENGVHEIRTQQQ